MAARLADAHAHAHAHLARLLADRAYRRRLVSIARNEAGERDFDELLAEVLERFVGAARCCGDERIELIGLASTLRLECRRARRAAMDSDRPCADGAGIRRRGDADGATKPAVEMALVEEPDVERDLAGAGAGDRQSAAGLGDPRSE